MSNTILSILLGGGLCALLDGLCVSALYLGKGAKFAPVWQSVASGLLGPGAYRGGWTTASFGLALHGLIAFTVATVFVLLSQKASVLLRHYILGGMAYGAAVWFVMYVVVLPVTNFYPKQPLTLSTATVEIAMHMFLIGLPISISTERLSR
jgi:hypothetical protein